MSVSRICRVRVLLLLSDRLASARPISLTSTLCKCMEKIIAKEHTNFLLDKQVIPNQQHGFLPRRSTFTNLLTKLNEWTVTDDNHEPVDVIYLAFDKIPTRYITYKIEHFGVRGNLLRTIASFLTERTFQERVGTALSKEYSVCRGVPQGSVLGPLLFIAYLSDF